MIKTRLIRLLSQAKKYIVYQVIWQWLALMCQVLVVYEIASLLDHAFGKKLTNASIVQSIIILIPAILLRFFCDRQASYASYEASVDVKQVLRKEIYEKLLRLGASYRERVVTSEVVQMSAEGVEQLETYFGRYLPQLFYSLLAPITLFIILSFVNVKASLVLLLCVPLIPIIYGLSKTKTVILISHRLANVTGSDNIYLLQDGCEIQSGTHKELMEQNGPYKKLYSYQDELESYSHGGKREKAVTV